MKKIALYLSMAMLAASLTACKSVQTSNESAATTVAAATKADETTKAGETTKAEETTKMEETTKEEETTTKAETSAAAALTSAAAGNTEVSANLFDFSVSVNGTVINIPVKMSAMAEMGFTLPAQKADFTINPNTFTGGSIENAAGNLLFGGFYNIGDEVIPMSDSMFGDISFKKRYTEGMELIFAGGIKLGATPAEVVAVAGEATEVSDGGTTDKTKREVYKYEKDGDSISEYVEFLFEDDKLTAVDFSTDEK